MAFSTLTPTRFQARGSLLFPKDVAQPTEVTVRDTSGPLRRLLTDYTSRIAVLESTVKDLETRLAALE
jgi:hypothetical protein